MNLNEYLNENARDIREYVQYVNEEKDIKLPYTFDIYNKGAKNSDYKITKMNIYKTFFRLQGRWSSSIVLPLPASELIYGRVNKETTDNWTKIPEFDEYTYAPVYYHKTLSKQTYNMYWSDWFDSLAPYFKGKLSVTLDKFKDDMLILKVNDKKFNEEREAKLKEMKDPENLKKWAEEASAKEKAEAERLAKEQEERKKNAEAYNKWWNSLSNAERVSYSMGYGRGSGSWTGD